MTSTTLPYRTSAAALGALMALAGIAGCTTDPERQNIPPAEVKVVQAYGETLDESSTPQQVAYMLLRAVADDIRASQAHNREAQKEALNITYSLEAYSTVEKRLLEVYNIGRPTKRTSLGEERDLELYGFARQWASILAYYVQSFPTDYQDALRRMRVAVTPDGQTAHVSIDLVHDPAAANQRAVIADIELTREPADGKSFWRVAKVSYQGPAASRPASATRPAESRPTSAPVEK